jgi:hypothetical protein
MVPRSLHAVVRPHLPRRAGLEPFEFDAQVDVPKVLASQGEGVDGLRHNLERLTAEACAQLRSKAGALVRGPRPR